VEELQAGDDRVVRAATIRICRENSSHSQLLHRSIKHLIPIEVRQLPDDQKVAEQGEDKQILPQSTRPQRDAAITGQLRRLKQSGVL
jgi:hypothetical protein